MSFRYISAGCAPTSFTGVNIYVKIKERKGPYKEKEYPFGYKIELSDRELFITKPGNRDYNFYLPVEGYDFCVDADMLGFDSAVKHSGIMLTYTEKKSKNRWNFDKLKSKTPIFGDSGGFQLLSGASEFIDPMELVKWYNRFVTRAMSLDIPLSLDTASYWKKSAEIQKKNTEFMMEHINPDITIYNGVHGFSVSERKKFIKLVDNPKIKHWAMGGSYYGNLLDLVISMYSVFEETKGESYHVFGIADTKLIPILAWIGRTYDITSDSSSPLQSGRCSTIFSNLPISYINDYKVKEDRYLTVVGKVLKKYGVGKVSGETFQTDMVHPNLPCSCPICYALNTTELYYHAKFSSACHTLCVMHNITVMNRYAEIWNDLAKKCTIKEYWKIYKDILSVTEKTIYKVCFGFIEKIEKTSVSQASGKGRKYARHSEMAKRRDDGVTLTQDNTVEYRIFDNQEADPNVLIERIESVIANYDSYYSDPNKFKSKKKKKKKKRNKQFDLDSSKKLMGIKDKRLKTHKRKKDAKIKKKPNKKTKTSKSKKSKKKK